MVHGPLGLKFETRPGLCPPVPRFPQLADRLGAGIAPPVCVIAQEWGRHRGEGRDGLHSSSTPVELGDCRARGQRWSRPAIVARWCAYHWGVSSWI